MGKQLRGVVSYLDGYGTNEVMESETVEADETSTPIIRGNSLYTIVDGPQWENAQHMQNWVGNLTISSSMTKIVGG